MTEVDPIHFGGIFDRIEWANKHGQACVDTIEGFVNTSPYMTHLDRDGDRWTWEFWRMIDEPTESIWLGEVARHFGAVLDNARAILNYLSYEIAQFSIREDPTLKGNLNPERVEFPIFVSRQLFAKDNRIKKLPDQYRKRIEAVQPYDRTNHPLWVLHELAREYRHRVVHPGACFAVGGFGGVFNRMMPAHAKDVEIIYRGGRLKHRDVLCTFVTDRPFDANAYPQPVIAVGIDHPLTIGKDATTVMQNLLGAVIDVVNGWIDDPAKRWTNSPIVNPNDGGAH